MMKYVYTFLGLVIILGVWEVICLTRIINPLLLPPPLQVFSSFYELWFQDYLLWNTLYSLKLNFLGYLQAIAVSLPLGFVLGLFPIVRNLFSRYIDAIRYIPLTATVGLFIAWFGIEDNMKVQFLAFGIFVFLLPTVVQRIDEVDHVYIDTVYTLGASRWQIVRSVYIPSVISRISDDIRVLVAISWTYLIVAELVNKTGGLGAMAYAAGRQSRIDKVFAILVLVMVIGILQDKLFIFLDRRLFPHKYKV